MNKKDLIEQGYTFEKVGKVEYINLCNKTSLTKEELKSHLDLAIELRNRFLEKGKERGKALSIILPLVSQSDMVQLLAELYELRIGEGIFAEIEEAIKDPKLHKLLKEIINSECKTKKLINKKNKVKGGKRKRWLKDH